ncbi:MAG: alpha/beta hydrolase [Lawsonella clevelandensis]
MVDDVHHVLMSAKAQNKGKKVFVIGHSMGAMATEALETKYPNDMDGTITNGGGIVVNPTARTPSSRSTSGQRAPRCQR